MTGKRWQFVDTNVLVYAHNPDDGTKHDRAEALFRSLWMTKEGCVSTQVLQEFYVTMTRKAKFPLSNQVAYNLVTSLASWRVHRPGIGDVLAAIEAHQRFNISYWDALILRSADQLGCDIVWSEDLNSGQKYGNVTVINPFADMTGSASQPGA
jgi:predicted nucleic acid-binding protein